MRRIEIGAAARAGDDREAPVRRHWRNRCVQAAHRAREEAEQLERDGRPELAERARRNVRFWIVEARAWNTALWCGTRAARERRSSAR